MRNLYGECPESLNTPLQQIVSLLIMSLSSRESSPLVPNAQPVNSYSMAHGALWSSCRPSTVCLVLLITSISSLLLILLITPFWNYLLPPMGIGSLVTTSLTRGIFRGSSKTSPTANSSLTPLCNIIECPETASINMSYYQNGDSFHRSIAHGVSKPIRVYEEAKAICDGPHLDKKNRSQSSSKHWKYCLPLWGNRNESECASVTRRSLLDPVMKPVCGSAVLDMLTHDVYRAMEEAGCNPMLTYGTALGAVRNGSHIPWTEDADLAYFTSADSGHSCVESAEFSRILRSRGYFSFKHHIWRVCITSDHPLAGQIYDINFSGGDGPDPHLCKEYGCNYVDLYATRNSSDGYSHQEHPQKIPHNKVLPMRTVTLNGAPFHTFNDVDWLLSAVYGEDYIKPKSRSDWINGMGK